VAAAERLTLQACRWSKKLSGHIIPALGYNAKSAVKSPQDGEKAEQQPGGVGLLLCFWGDKRARVVTAARLFEWVIAAQHPRQTRASFNWFASN
jgi:hypothetical protein